MPSVEELKKLIGRPVLAPKNVAPFTEFSPAPEASGKVEGMGCLILAGGQGTRLGFDGPKGAFEVTYDGKSLFELFCERTPMGCLLAIMTSPSNHAQTIAFFERNAFFGRKISFFQQETLPILSDEGEVLGDGPNGNGHAIKAFFDAGLWEEWKTYGVRYLNIIPVDNALADPFDGRLAHCLEKSGADVVIKATERCHPDEKVGLIVLVDGKVEVIEYSEVKEDGPEYVLANLGLYCLTMDFAKRVALKSECFPLHLARKLVPGTKTVGWKFETFLFDMLPLADRVEVLVYPREECFAPLKNEKGADSIETVREALEMHLT